MVTLKQPLNQEKKQIELTVSDQGPGVPDNMITELFSPFFRVADGRERSSGGTGLGLAIAQQAIHLHQGEIYAQNRQPNGLKVIIKLPLSLS
jgi:two-component system sensor histidine kinase CpxA